jgi:hypothetical protein
MFQFPGFAFVPYEFRYKYLLGISASPRPSPRGADLRITDIEGGFPHSEILGSKLVRSSPRLIAAYHVLHRLSAPRHPPDTLKALDRSHYRCPPLGSSCWRKPTNDIDTKDQFTSNTPGSAAVKPRPLTEMHAIQTLDCSKVRRIRMCFLFTM